MPAREAWFEPLHPGSLGERFCVRHPAAGPIQGLVLFVHPFSEELNRTRRMAALQSQRLAAAGYEVWQLDLFGCGDSPGEFGAASWEQWLSDIRAAVRQLQARAAGRSPVWLWGLRLGCLLAAQAAQGLVGPLNFLFWQPLLTGQAQLQMLLRLVSASELLARQDPGETAALRQRLSQAQPTEIGGYELSTEMLQGLQQARLQPPHGVSLGRTVWLEVTSANALASVSPVVIQACQAWIEAGSVLHYQQVVGPAFWHLAECDDATELLSATVDALRGSPAAVAS